MSYIWRGWMYDEATRRTVIVYFAGWLSKGWPNLTTNLGEATRFMSQSQARGLLRDTKNLIPWMGAFAVAKHPNVTENRG